MEAIVDKALERNITLDEFSEKYCKMCGTQLCGGVYDKEFREGCAYYQREVLKQPTMHDILTSLRPSYPKVNSIQKAYEVLYKVFSDKNHGWDDAEAAIDEALEHLHEVLTRYEAKE